MLKLELDVIKDTCLGREVFRGSIKAKDLLPACWIDFHDLDRNPEGYQRPFNQERSQLAAEYAESSEGGFWPECILSIRDEPVDDDSHLVRWTFKEVKGTDGKFGKLIVKYNDNVENIGDQDVPWRRAFSEVDCQHRLGSMSDSNKFVTFCIFPGISRRDEAIIFKTINEKQKKIDSSLVDAIVLRNEPGVPIHIVWAYDLGTDPASPFNRRVSTGGRNLEPPDRLVTLRTLRTCLNLTIPKRSADLLGDLGYNFLRNFWNVVAQNWPSEFQDTKNSKLMTVPGLRGLSRFGKGIFLSLEDSQDFRESRIAAKFGSPTAVDWSTSGPLRDATGNAGGRVVYELLRKVYS